MTNIELLRLLARVLMASDEFLAVEVIEDDEEPSLAVMIEDGTRVFLTVDERISPFGVAW